MPGIGAYAPAVSFCVSAGSINPMRRATPYEMIAEATNPTPSARANTPKAWIG
jgi:hypothetical protein